MLILVRRHRRKNGRVRDREKGHPLPDAEVEKELAKEALLSERFVSNSAYNAQRIEIPTGTNLNRRKQLQGKNIVFAKADD